MGRPRQLSATGYKSTFAEFSYGNRFYNGFDCITPPSTSLLDIILISDDAPKHCYKL